jgi:hypothetical protein
MRAVWKKRLLISNVFFFVVENKFWARNLIIQFDLLICTLFQLQRVWCCRKKLEEGAEGWVGKDLEGGSRDLFQSSKQKFSIWYWGNPMKISVIIFHNMAEILIGYLYRILQLNRPVSALQCVCASSRPVLGPTQPPIQWVPGALSPGVKRQGREADHSPLTNAEVNKTWIYTSTPPYTFMA